MLRQLIREALLTHDRDDDDVEERPTALDVIALFGPPPRRGAALDARLELWQRLRPIAAAAIAGDPRLRPQGTSDAELGSLAQDVLDNGTRAQRARLQRLMLAQVSA